YGFTGYWQPGTVFGYRGLWPTCPSHFRASALHSLHRFLGNVSPLWCQCRLLGVYGMAAPGNSPIAIAFEGLSGTGSIPTPVLLAGMLRASEKVSDLVFSPGRPPQVEIHGQLTAVEISESST